MHISNLDIKTMTIFSNVMRLRNLSQAASHLGLTQPAISQAITRLRKHFGDALLVRTGRGMEPTPRALELLEGIDAVLAIVHEKLESRAAFDPTGARRTFTFYSTDFGATLLLPRLVNALREVAPNIAVRAHTNNFKPAAHQLEAGEADLAFGAFTDLGGTFYQQQLFRDHHVCLAGRLFPPVTTLGKSAFRAASHVVVRPLPQGYHMVEELMRNELTSGRVALEVPNFLSLLMVLRETDMLCTVPARVGLAVGKLLGLRSFTPPFSLPTLNIKMFWHERLHRDPAHQWLRALAAQRLRMS
ncbi:LysR family transcriptional regulator [Variovorax defluvii]|uniref:LysR family transcriptional regulator n=1 Tax=Variovorax defluvii TaxID=913761 RepID=A0ABP8IDB1_9BURK